MKAKKQFRKPRRFPEGVARFFNPRVVLMQSTTQKPEYLLNRVRINIRRCRKEATSPFVQH